MMNKIWTFIGLLWGFSALHAQDTFSIVAIDTTNHEIGSAGASCLDSRVIFGGVRIISDVIPGLGAAHTQALFVSGNQLNVRTRMMMGEPASAIIDWVSQDTNDVAMNASIRQYGVVTLDTLTGTFDAAAFTGANCLDVKTQRVGPNYAIQGNILLNEAVLDSMEARFLRTEGELADKLMAAMQGANIPGADSRCLGEGVSSQSAFIRVAKPEDLGGSFYLDISVPRTLFGVEPIDSVQALFDVWKRNNATSVDPELVALSETGISYDATLSSLIFRPTIQAESAFFLYNMQGKLLQRGAVTPGMNSVFLGRALSTGIYFITFSKEGRLVSKKFMVR